MQMVRTGGEVGMDDKPNKVTTVLKVVVTGEFYDDDATEETLRYAVEQDLEDAGFDVDVALLKEQPEIVRCRDCYFGKLLNNSPYLLCSHSYHKGNSFVGDYYCASGVKRSEVNDRQKN